MNYIELADVIDRTMKGMSEREMLAYAEAASMYIHVCRADGVFAAPADPPLVTLGQGEYETEVRG